MGFVSHIGAGIARMVDGSSFYFTSYGTYSIHLVRIGYFPNRYTTPAEYAAVLS
jgi:hypothetical protein